MSVTTIEKLSELKKFLSANKRLFLYSAGFATGNFLQSMSASGISLKTEGVLVTNSKGNPNTFWDIPVIQYDKSALKKENCILLTVSERFKEKSKKISDSRYKAYHYYKRQL